jgi:hypothetical protein
MKNMNLTELNKKLKNVSSLPVVESSDTFKQNDYEYETDYYTVVDLGDGVYLKLSYYRDSYGYKEFVGMQFVEPKQVIKTGFEPI